MGNCFGFHPAPDPNNSTSTRPSTPGKSRGYSNGEGTSSSSTNAVPHSQSWASLSDDSCFTGEILATPNLRNYSFDELRIAAKNFRVDMMLGVGGFGTVYKGWVDGKTLGRSRSSGTSILVAIKKLNSESTQGFKEWQSEVDFLGRLWHPNLVRLLGYCLEDKELLLVYEFMQKGSLENHLFRRNADSLSWDLRLKIAIGAARGLAFLHTADQKVIYRDFKASNILLDGSYNAKISDFGLAKLGPSGGDTHVTTRVMGTHGYAAPEYVATGHLYVKSDVYGFGVVLLEMLTGLRAFDSRRPSYQHNLVDWAKPCLRYKRKLKTIMDPHIEGQYSSKAAYEAAQLTLKCLDEEHKKRPAMKEVVLTLEHIAALQEPKSMTLSHHRPGQSLRSPLHMRS